MSAPMSQPTSGATPGPRWQVHQLPRVAEAAVSRARLRLVPRRRTRAARMPFVTLVSILLLAGVVGLLCLNTSMQKSAFAQTDLADDADRLAARVEALQAETRELRSPQHLAEFAQSAAGGRMVVPPWACQVDLAVVATSRPAVVCPDEPPATEPAEPLRLHPRPGRAGR